MTKDVTSQLTLTNLKLLKQEVCEDADNNDSAALDFLNDDRLSQSTSSSHVTENVISGDLQADIDHGLFNVEVKQVCIVHTSPKMVGQH